MENDIILVLAYGVVIIGLIGTNAALLAFGLPKVDAAYNALWLTVFNFAPIARRLFDPNTRLAKALEANGMPANIADQIVEAGMDVLVKRIEPYLIETGEALPK
jgi:hypothetical protein